jgi:hypothetical protein
MYTDGLPVLAGHGVVCLPTILLIARIFASLLNRTTGSPCGYGPVMSCYGFFYDRHPLKAETVPSRLTFWTLLISAWFKKQFVRAGAM